MLYPRVEWQHDITASVDISGNPCIVVDSNERVYFAISARGTVESLEGDDTHFSIVVGCVDNTGVLQWILRDPRMVTTTEDIQPVLALGTSNTLYVCFTTMGAVPGATNGADTFSLCGNCGSAAAGREDIVVARINEIQTGAPAVDWVKQDAYLNSCNRETSPRLLFDMFQERLLIAYECTGATLCKVALGNPNIVIACLTPAGDLSWAYQEELLNGRGQNRSPSIAVDGEGGIYVAYSITRPVEGGAALQGSQDVEVVKLSADILGCGLVIQRPWILSNRVTINAPLFASNETPSLACDPVTGHLFLTFTTTGQVPGGEKSAADKDIVFVSLTSEGDLRWIRQGPVYNEITYRYRFINTPSLALDCLNRLYIAALAYDTNGYDMLVMFRLNKENGNTEWYYRQDLGSVYRAYVPIANFETPFTTGIFEGTLTPPWVSACVGHVYVATTKLNLSTTSLIALRQQEPFLDVTAFQYMVQAAASQICEDPEAAAIAVQVQAVTAVSSSVMFTYNVVDENGNPIQFEIPPETSPVQERIDALSFFVTVLQQTYVIIDNTTGNQVMLESYTTQAEHIRALLRYIAIFMTTYTILDENGEPIVFDIPQV